jgi:dTDP-4-dehydrorhamnose reductase
VGASGLVGSALLRTMPDAIGTYYTRPVPGLRRLDARDADALRRLADERGATALFFPAAQANVEWCETHPSEAEDANIAPLRSATAVARERGMTLVAYSSDYVFDGVAGPYAEDDPVSPISVYGRIKRAVERLALDAGAIVIRTTGVFGSEPLGPRNFVLRLVASLARGESVRVPNDQWSTPTYADDVARASAVLVGAAAAGLWHVAGPDLVSREELARRAARVFGVPTTGILAVPTASLGQRAARPLRGGLRTEKLRAFTGFAPRSLDAALANLRSVVAAAR